MTAIRIGPFGPITPRTAERQLPQLSAQVAANVNLLSGEIRPIRNPELVSAHPDAVSVYRAEHSTTETWRAWTVDVDVARAPFAASVLPRYVWTGDGPPKTTNFTNFGTVASDLTLGIPVPQTAPGVAASGGVGAATSRLYVYTFYSQDGEESGPSPASTLVTGKVDDTWAITLIDAVPANSGVVKGFFSTDTIVANATGAAVTITSSTAATPIVVTRVAHGFVTGDRVFITGHLVNTAANNTYANPIWTIIRLTADTYSLTGSIGNGVGGATGNAYKCTYHWLRASDQVTISAATRTVTAVPTAYTFNVATDLTAATTWARVANWNTTSMKRRLYRSAGTTATYQLVVEDTAGTTYNDTILDVSIPGDELISIGWQPPPVDLFAVSSLPNGALVGISGTLVCFSEPYQPHAWLEAYQFGMDQEGVGLSTFGSTVVIGTSGAPYIADGVDPTSVTLQRIDSVWPCLAKRSFASDEAGVMYATNVGLAYIGQQAPTIVTKGLFTRDNWTALNPSSMITVSAEGKTFVRYQALDADVSTILLFIPDEQTATLTTLDIDCTELYADPRNGYMYVVDSEGVKQYNSNVGARIPSTWESKEFELPVPTNLGAARVEFVSDEDSDDAAAIAAAYAAALVANAITISNGYGALNGRGAGLNFGSIDGETPALPRDPNAAISLTFSLYSKGVLVFSKTLSNSDAFRMPAGYLSDAYAVKVNGSVRVKNIKLAETMVGLNKV